MGLADLDEVGRIEHSADPELQCECLAPWLAEFAGEHGLFFIGEEHPGSPRWVG